MKKFGASYFANITNIVSKHRIELQICLIICALFVIIWVSWLTNYLTVRDIEIPIGKYNTPYSTHGGVVYITTIENSILVTQWILTIVLVVSQMFLNFITRPRNRESDIREKYSK